MIVGVVERTEVFLGCATIGVKDRGSGGGGLAVADGSLFEGGGGGDGGGGQRVRKS